MADSGWGWDVLEQDEALTGRGQLYATKTRKGENGKITLSHDKRRLYQLQKFLEACVEGPGGFAQKRALVLILEDLRLSIVEAKKAQARSELLRKHGISNA